MPGRDRTPHADDDVEYVYLDEDGNPIENPSTEEIEAAVLVAPDHPIVSRRIQRKLSQPSKAERRSMGIGRRLLFFFRRHRIISGVAIVFLPYLLFTTFTVGRALTKEGQESFDARLVQGARDAGLGPVVDWVEGKYYDSNQPESGGTPQQGIGPAVGGAGPIRGGSDTTTGGTEPGPGPTSTTTAVPLRDHTPLPTKMKTPAAEPIPNEGEWFPAGPDVGGGLHPVYTTKVRPNAEKTSLLVFVAWVDPKLADIRLFPGSELPGGTWALPHFVTPELCKNLVFAGNGGFRFEVGLTGFYSEGREAVKLKDGAASLVLMKDGSVNVVQWGRELGNANLDLISSVRQNLPILVDNGAPGPQIDQNVWGALLPNSYFVWRSAWGVTKDGALVYAGGPGLTPRNLADTMINAGAVRALEFDINPEWVTGNLYTVDATGKCKGTRGLDATEDKGGMRKPGDRYLSLDTRDFVAVFSKQP